MDLRARNHIGNQADLKPQYDVVVIGSGAGGSSLAYRLAERGVKVLVVERGDYLVPQLPDAAGPIGKYLYHVIKKGGEGLSFVGGQTKFYGAALYRLRESDFRAVAHEKGSSPAWPITYSDLEPYYRQSEILYRVHGSPDGDAYEPPRSSPFPFPPIKHHPIVSDVVDNLERSGTRVSAIPLGIDYSTNGRCVLCATCDAHYCQLDAKMDAEIAALRPALASGNVQLTTRTECLRILTDVSGSRVNGVLLSRGGEEYIVRAGSVAVCAGIPGSALILRRSKNEAHPEGLGNAGGALGRYMSGHSVGYVFPLVRWKKLPPMHTKTFAINGFYGASPDWPFPTGIMQIAGQMPFWETASRAIRPIARRIADHSLTCFYSTEALPTRESGLIFEDDTIKTRVEPLHNSATFARLRSLAVDAFRRAGYPVTARRRRPYLWHEVGTACFGTDPVHSIADPNCQVHGVENLYVVDQSVLPSAGAVNTCLTIIALALRTGDHIAGHRKAEANKKTLSEGGESQSTGMQRPQPEWIS